MTTTTIKEWMNEGTRTKKHEHEHEHGKSGLNLRRHNRVTQTTDEVLDPQTDKARICMMYDYDAQRERKDRQMMTMTMRDRNENEKECK